MDISCSVSFTSIISVCPSTESWFNVGTTFGHSELGGFTGCSSAMHGSWISVGLTVTSVIYTFVLVLGGIVSHF